MILRDKKNFEVRNSPLNRFSSMFANLLYCMKVGCTIGGGAASILGAGTFYDTVLVESGQERIFVPTVTRLYKYVYGIEDGIDNKITDLNKNNPVKFSSMEEVSVVTEKGKEIKVSGNSISEFLTNLNNLPEDEKKLFLEGLKKEKK